ncbi:hypothetical protein DFP72DRAFT_1045675 [Ephemerocybe angulata]|uniref:Uncharacterized protein n=1 Tax=Ephemerocybe angulata TaxID=980116 RepID=A0A8H6M6Y4_9AGAR|nr:hypothetical protein DFP72DRAFT_1045675 [Tulosesus angulatus]
MDMEDVGSTSPGFHCTTLDPGGTRRFEKSRAEGTLELALRSSAGLWTKSMRRVASEFARSEIVPPVVVTIRDRGEGRPNPPIPQIDVLPHSETIRSVAREGGTTHLDDGRCTIVASALAFLRWAMSVDNVGGAYSALSVPVYRGLPSQLPMLAYDRGWLSLSFGGDGVPGRLLALCGTPHAFSGSLHIMTVTLHHPLVFKTSLGARARAIGLPSGGMLDASTSLAPCGAETLSSVRQLISTILAFFIPHPYVPSRDTTSPKPPARPRYPTFLCREQDAAPTPRIHTDRLPTIAPVGSCNRSGWLCMWSYTACLWRLPLYFPISLSLARTRVCTACLELRIRSGSACRVDSLGAG